MSDMKPLAVSVERGPDGQWVFDPPFQGGTYAEFKAWQHHAQNAVNEFLQSNDPAHGLVVGLGIPDIKQVFWDALSENDALAFAAEAINSGDAEAVLTLSWDFGTLMHSGTNSVWKIGERFFVDHDEGLSGPFPSLAIAMQESELDKPLSAGMNYESNSLTASEIAARLGCDYLTGGEEILINGERWAVNLDDRFSRIDTKSLSD